MTAGEFWAWFLANEARPRDAEVERNDGGAFDELLVNLRSDNEKLGYGVSPPREAGRSLLISADGCAPHFPAVDALVAAAPALLDWRRRGGRGGGVKRSALCMGILAMVTTTLFASADQRDARDRVLAGMRAVMGDPPDRADLPALDLRVTEVERGDGYERRTVSFASHFGERVTAYVYVPAGLKPGERRPGVLALHPTGEPGKAIVDGRGPKLGRGYGMELAARGYVVVAPDYPSFGEQKDYDFKKSKYASGTMKAIADNMRCVDLLRSMPEVDGEKIAAIGHSLGGHNALFTAAFEERIKVAVTSCGWTPFRYYYGGKKLANWAQDRYMPRVRDVYASDPGRMPFDFPGIIAGAIAPRAVFSNSPTGDENFDVAGVRAAEPEIRAAYERAGAAGEFAVVHPAYGHDFGDAERREAYRFIDRQFGFTPVKELP